MEDRQAWYTLKAKGTLLEFNLINPLLLKCQNKNKIEHDHDSG